MPKILSEGEGRGGCYKVPYLKRDSLVQDPCTQEYELRSNAHEVLTLHLGWAVRRCDWAQLGSAATSRPDLECGGA